MAKVTKKITAAMHDAAENMKAGKKGSGLPMEERRRIKELEKKVEQLTKKMSKVEKIKH